MELILEYSGFLSVLQIERLGWLGQEEETYTQWLWQLLIGRICENLQLWDISLDDFDLMNPKPIQQHCLKVISSQAILFAAMRKLGIDI